MVYSPGDNECEIETDEKPPRPVTIYQGFWLGQTEVTQAEWIRLKGQNPGHFIGEQLPVEEATWNEASGFCKAGVGRLPTEQENLFACGQILPNKELHPPYPAGRTRVQRTIRKNLDQFLKLQARRTQTQSQTEPAPACETHTQTAGATAVAAPKAA